MTSMVVKASSSCTQVTSLSVQEKGSRNKRKFHADPPLSDPCEVLSLPNDCPDYEFSADELLTDKYKIGPVHGQVMGCDLCGVKGDHADALKLELGLSNAISASDLGSKEEGEVDEFHDADWSDLTETQLEELVLSSLDAIFKSAIFKIVSNGYTQDVATRAVLRSGLCYGSKDIVSNIVNNTLAYLKNDQEVDPSRDHCFEDLQQLERYVLVELVCILQAVRPFFSTGDAMWCLLLCDMNVSHACAMDGDPLSNFLNDGVSNASSFTAPQPELKPEAKSKDAKSSAAIKPTPKMASSQGSQLGKDSLARSLNLNKQKIFHALHETTSGKESSTAVSVSVDKSVRATMMQQTTTPEDKPVPSRKLHSNSTKRESVLRQKSSPVEKSHRTYDTKGVSRAAKLSGLGGLILDRKLRESAGINLKNASIRMKALGVDLSISQTKSTISLSTNSMLKSASSSSFSLDKLTSIPASPKSDKQPTVSAFNSQALAAADTELVLSLPAKSNPPPVALNKSEEVPKCSYPVVPFDKSFGQWIPQDKKDEMIMKLYPRLRELQNQLHEWTEWANQKVMQAAHRLSKDKAELKMLRQEREEVQRLKKEKQTLADSTIKKLSEMENALTKASGQVERANSAIRRLEIENRTLRQEMEAAKLRATESATSCQEAVKREKKTLNKFHSWEKQKIMFQEELAAEIRKLTHLQKEVQREKDHLLQLEARWKQEEKGKDEVLAQAESTRQEREQLEASTKSKEESVKSKGETNLQRYKDDIKKLEKEISQLRLKADSSKIAALKMGIDGSYPNRATPAKASPASESQPPYKGGMHGFQDEAGVGGVKRERECVMCLSEEMSVVFLPCAHQVVCTMCNELHQKQGMKECPSCRSAIQRRICTKKLIFRPLAAVVPAAKAPGKSPIILAARIPIVSQRRRSGKMGWESYVVVHNIAKRHNVGTLARSATAFGVSEMILVGRRDFNAFGSHGSTSHVRFRHFHSLLDARNFLKERDCDICGVEITDNAVAVNQHPFKKSTAFLLGNEGTGLSTKECEICDFFIYIPQYGCGTASLNVTVAASIVLHHFAVWAGYPERTRDGSKYVVAEKPQRQMKKNFCSETDEKIIEERRARKESASIGFFEENQNDNSSSNLLETLFDG